MHCINPVYNVNHVLVVLDDGIGDEKVLLVAIWDQCEDLVVDPRHMELKTTILKASW